MSSRTRLVLWLALLAAFSAAIAEFVRDYAAGSSSPTTLLTPVLMAVCGWRGAVRGEQPRRAGVALIVVGLLLEAIGVASRTWTVAWLGLPVAVVGMALWLGRPSWRIAALAFGLVPVPVSLQLATTPTAESALLSAACAAWRTLGLAFSCTGPVARIDGRHLDLHPGDAGWTLAAVLAQLGWFHAVSAGASGWQAVGRALAFAAAVIVVQPLAIGLALGLLAVGSADVARAWLSYGVWLVCAAIVLLGSARAGWRPAPPPHGEGG
jgi:hypothetical protein